MTPFVVGLGGTVRGNSSSERSLRVALEAAEDEGARTLLLSAADLALPMYSPDAPDRTPAAVQLVRAIDECDGLLIASPGYHGGYSGLIKNALDYTEDLRDQPRPYLDGRAVGLISTALGWQAAVTTLAHMRDVVHALRGWPTPLGVAINSAEPLFGPDGDVVNPSAAVQLDLVGRQVVQFARWRAGTPA